LQQERELEFVSSDSFKGKKGDNEEMSVKEVSFPQLSPNTARLWSFKKTKIRRITMRARLIFVCSNQAEVLALAPNNEVCVVDDLSTGRVENLPIASGIE